MRTVMSFGLAITLASTAMADAPRVVTDIPPVHSLVAQVMGDLGTPQLLLERGADEHDFQLRPSQMAALNEADLVVWIGPELTPWLERALQGVPDSVLRMGLLESDRTRAMEYGQETVSGAFDPAQLIPKTGMDHDHGHQNSDLDPHVWLSTANARQWVDAIAEELSRLDPENAATYRANAVSAATEILAADDAARTLLGPVADRPFVVVHDAYRYFAFSYQLNVAGTVSTGDAAAPGAARLAQLREMVSAGGAVCLFPEVQHDPAVLEQIADDSGARIGGALDPVGSTYEPGPQMYAALIAGMAETIAACLSES